MSAATAGAVEAARRSALPRRALRSLPRLALAVVAGLVGLSVLLRAQNLAGPFWIDEGLSVGISSHAFTDIPGVLRQDGSPPLYYLLLHVWGAVFGHGVVTTHLLSLLFALLAIPAGLWAGWTLFGRRAGLMAAALFAVNPLLSAYAQEARMYSLLALLGLVSAAAFVRVFVHRDRRLLPLFVAALAAMLYTHNWATFFVLGALAALAVVALLTRRPRALALDALIGFGVPAVLYAPWLPTLLFQARHTGAPWASHPSAAALTRAPDLLLGGSQASIAVLLGAGAGLVQIASRRELSRDALAVVALLVIVIVGVCAAFVYSQLSLAWAARYLTVFLAPLLLAVALGLARARSLGIVAFALLVCICVARTSTAVSGDKSNIDQVRDAFGASLHPGDVVISTQPEQVPNLRYYLGGQFTYATPTGRVADDRVMDWRDAVKRLRAARVSRDLRPLIGRLSSGTEVLLVTPITHRRALRAPWTRLVRRRTVGWRRALAADPRLRPLGLLHLGGRRSSLVTVRATLYERR